MKSKNTKVIYVLISLLFTFIDQSVTASTFIDVILLGAKPDGKTYSTKSVREAWARACASPKSAQIYVPPGKYLIKNVGFRGPCKNVNTTFQIDGTLVAPSDYNVVGNSTYWISFKSVSGVSIYGGTLDGRGRALWACKHANKICPEGATSLAFKESKDIVIDGLESLNSQMFHTVIKNCQNVNVRGMVLTAPGNSPNTDGIHVQGSSDVTIMHSGIKTGDDCISIGPGTRNLWVEHIACGPGHGISIGSLGKDHNEQSVQNVTVKTVAFTHTQNGVRIKTWGRPSNGFVNGVLFQHIVMNNVLNPIVINQNYCPLDKSCPHLVSGIKISQVTYRDIRGTTATPVAVKFHCSTKNPCVGIKLENVKLTHRNHPAVSSCANAHGSVHGVVQPAGCF